MNRMFVRNNVTHKHFPVKPVAATVFIINTRQTSCGNVFTQVCVSVCPKQRSLPMMPLVSHMPPPPPPPGHVQSCSLEGLPLPTWGLPPDMFTLAHYVSQTSISKWTVGLRLKCLPFIVCFGWVVVLQFNIICVI